MRPAFAAAIVVVPTIAFLCFIALCARSAMEQDEALEKLCHDNGGIRVKVMGGYACISQRNKIPQEKAR